MAPLGPLCSAGTITLGASDTGTPVTVDLAETRHGLIVYGTSPYGERIGARIAANATNQDANYVEVWTVTPSGFTFGAITTTDRKDLPSRAADALHTAYTQRLAILKQFDQPDFDGYWKYQQDNPSAPRLRRVLLAIDNYESLCSDLFRTALTEAFARSRTPGINIQLRTSAYPTDLDPWIGIHLGYRAVLHDEQPDTYTQALPDLAPHEIDSLPTKPGSGLLHTTRDHNLTRFHYETESQST